MSAKFCIYCGADRPDYAAFCRNCGRSQQRDGAIPTFVCTYCGADTPNHGSFCENCGRQHLERASSAEIIFQPGLPISGIPLPGGQAPTLLAGQIIGNVPMVQGTPQASSVPFVQGSPFNPSADSSIPQQAASSWGPQSSSMHISPPQAEPPIHHPGQPPAYHPVHDAPGQPPIHHPRQPPIRYQPKPPSEHPVHQHPGDTSSHHLHQQQPGQVSFRQTGTIHPVRGTGNRRAVTGGIKAAGGLSRRALLTMLIGGAVTVAVASGGTAAYLASSSSAKNNHAPPAIVSTPDKTALMFCNALKNGDSQAAYNQLSSRVQRRTNERQFANNVQQAFNYRAVTECAVSRNVQQNGSTATLTLRITIFGFVPTAYKVTLVKENGIWKVDGAVFLGL